MTLILSGTNGVSDVDGSASTPAIRGSDTNTGIFFPAADTIAFAEGGAEVMRIDSAGNVGIGTSSPSFKLQVSGSSLGRAFSLTDTNSNSSVSGQVTNGTNSLVFGINNSAGNGMNGGGAFGAVIESSGAYPLAFVTNATERARIDSSGNMYVGSSSGAAIERFGVYQSTANVGLFVTVTAASSTANPGVSIRKADNNNTTAQTYVTFAFNNGASGAGGIQGNGASGAQFFSSSDQRLKENIVDLEAQLPNILALKPRRFDFIDGAKNCTGFIAQEMEEVYPDAVGETPDGYKTIGGISTMEARLIKAIQEQQALIDDLTARIAALEGAQA